MKKKNKFMLLAGIAAVIAVVVMVCIFVVPEKDSGTTAPETEPIVQPDFIVLDGEDGYYLADLTADEIAPVKLCEKSDFEYVNRFIFNDDQSSVLYFNSVEENTNDYFGEWWLYDTETMKKNLVCDNAEYYIEVSKNFDALLYYRGEERTLCYKSFDKDEVIEIAENGPNCFVTENLDDICYESEGNVYRYNPDGENILVAEDMEVCGFDVKTGEVFLYNYENGMLMKNNGNKTEVVVESADVEYGFYLEPAGYYQLAANNIDISGCIIDDMYEQDKNSSSSYGKEARDIIRKSISDNDFNIELYSLVYYDGKEHAEIFDNVICSLTDTDYISDIKNDVGIHLVLEDYELPKIKMSEFVELNLIDEYAIREYIRVKFVEQSKAYVTKEDKIIGEIGICNGTGDCYIYDGDTETLCIKSCGAGDEENYKSSYYKVCIKDEALGEVQTIAENVLSNYGGFCVVGDELIYDSGRSIINNYFTLYADDKVIAEDVELINQLDEDVLFISCKGEKKGENKNFFYINGETKKIDGLDDYIDFYMTKGGHIVSTEHYDGKVAVLDKKGELRYIEDFYNTIVIMPIETYEP